METSHAGACVGGCRVHATGFLLPQKKNIFLEVCADAHIDAEIKTQKLRHRQTQTDTDAPTQLQTQTRKDTHTHKHAQITRARTHTHPHTVPRVPVLVWSQDLLLHRSLAGAPAELEEASQRKGLEFPSWSSACKSGNVSMPVQANLDASSTHENCAPPATLMPAKTVKHLPSSTFSLSRFTATLHFCGTYGMCSYIIFSTPI